MDWQPLEISSDSKSLLDQTSESIVRSHQLAIEHENIGNEILSDLDEQRVTLLQSQSRLENATEELSDSARMINSLRKHFLYNKSLLMLIILLEVLILTGQIIIKFFN